MEVQGFKHGFDDRDWEQAKDEARAIMYAVAAKESLISYSELVKRVHSVSMEAHDHRLDNFLGQIATEDDASGKGLTTVVVVHKSGDQMPGPGFFEMAQSQGRTVVDPVETWMTELKSVYDRWSDKPD